MEAQGLIGTPRSILEALEIDPEISAADLEQWKEDNGNKNLHHPMYAKMKNPVTQVPLFEDKLGRVETYYAVRVNLPMDAPLPPVFLIGTMWWLRGLNLLRFTDFLACGKTGKCFCMGIRKTANGCRYIYTLRRADMINYALAHQFQHTQHPCTPFLSSGFLTLPWLKTGNQRSSRLARSPSCNSHCT